MAVRIFNCQLDFHRSGNHVFQEDLKRHGVSAALVGNEELAIALEISVIEYYVMVIIVAVKSQIEFIESEALALLCVTFCLFSLADHS